MTYSIPVSHKGVRDLNYYSEIAHLTSVVASQNNASGDEISSRKIVGYLISQQAIFTITLCPPTQIHASYHVEYHHGGKTVNRHSHILTCTDRC